MPLDQKIQTQTVMAGGSSRRHHMPFLCLPPLNDVAISPWDHLRDSHISNKLKKKEELRIHFNSMCMWGGKDWRTSCYGKMINWAVVGCHGTLLLPSLSCLLSHGELQVGQINKQKVTRCHFFSSSSFLNECIFRSSAKRRGTCWGRSLQFCFRNS